jgi:hypothetical protein
LGENKHAMERKKTQDLLAASEEVGEELNAEKTKCVFMSRDQNAGQNYDIKMGNKAFENVGEVQVFGDKTNK